jgi:hypothetical protein
MPSPTSRLLRALTPGLATVALVAFSNGASAQVTAEQQSANRASCRSDFMSKCSGVTPGGKDAPVCLQKNVASLSPACKTAVSATIPAPAQAAPAPAPAPAAPVTAAPGRSRNRRAAEGGIRPERAAAASQNCQACEETSGDHRRAHAGRSPGRRSAAISDTRAQRTGGDDRRHWPVVPARSGPALPRYTSRRWPQACLMTAHSDSLTPLCRAAMNITTPLR